MSKSKSGLNRGSPMGFIGDWDGSVLGKQGIFSQQQPVPNCKTVIFNFRRIKIAQTSSAQSGDSNRWLQS